MIKLNRLLRRAHSISTGHVPVTRDGLDRLIDLIEVAYIRYQDSRLLAEMDALDSMVLGG